jgi:WD40 repeat protein
LFIDVFSDEPKYKKTILFTDIAKQLLAHESDSPMRLEIDEQYSTSSSLSSLPASVTTHVQKMRLTDAISKRALAGSNRRLDLLNVTHHTISCRPRFLTLPEDPMVVLSYNHWDNTIQVARFEEANATRTDNGVTRAQQAIAAHKRPVTCAAIDKLFLVTGSADGSAAVWRCDYKRRDRKEGFGIITPALYTIHCHIAPLTAVAINRDWDIIVTGSEDGVLSVHHLDLRRQDTRALISLGACISSIVISPVDGSFVVYTSSAPLGIKRQISQAGSSTIPPNNLYRYSINAELLSELKLTSESNGQLEIASMLVTLDGKYLVTAGGVTVAVRRLFDLSTVYKYQTLPGDAFSAAFDPDQRALFVSTTDGKIVSFCKRDGSVLLP